MFSPGNSVACEAFIEFPVCTTSLCVDMLIKEDTTLEKEERFLVFVILGLEEFLSNITVTKDTVIVSILDNDDGGENKYCLDILQCHWMN